MCVFLVTIMRLMCAAMAVVNMEAVTLGLWIALVCLEVRHMRWSDQPFGSSW